MASKLESRDRTLEQAEPPLEVDSVDGDYGSSHAARGDVVHGSRVILSRFSRHPVNVAWEPAHALLTTRRF